MGPSNTLQRTFLIFALIIGIMKGTESSPLEEDFLQNDVENNEILEGADISSDKASDCYAMGFNPHNLLCSSCDLLDTYQLNELRVNCFKCCSKSTFEPEEASKSDQEVKKYPKAILEVCNCKLKYLPHLDDFLKSELRGKYPKLIQKHVEGAWPTISLINNAGKVEETFSITKWNGETIADFLETYLVSL